MLYICEVFFWLLIFVLKVLLGKTSVVARNDNNSTNTSSREEEGDRVLEKPQQIYSARAPLTQSIKYNKTTIIYYYPPILCFVL